MPIIVNIDKLCEINVEKYYDDNNKQRNKTVIYFDRGQQEVMESPEKIYQMIPDEIKFKKSDN